MLYKFACAKNKTRLSSLNTVYMRTRKEKLRAFRFPETENRWKNIFQQNTGICKTCNCAVKFLDAICHCQACEKTCYQRKVIEQCQCSDAYFPPSNASAFNHVIVPVCSTSNLTQGAIRKNAESFRIQQLEFLQYKSFNTIRAGSGNKKCRYIDLHCLKSWWPFF